MQWEKEETGELQRRWPRPILPWQLYHLCELIGAECRVHLGLEMDRNNLHFLTVLTKQPHCPTEQDTGGTSEQNKTAEKKPFKPFGGGGQNISHVSEKHTRNGDLCFYTASEPCLRMALLLSRARTADVTSPPGVPLGSSKLPVGPSLSL